MMKKDNEFFRTEPKRLQLQYINFFILFLPIVCGFIAFFHSSFELARLLDFDKNFCGVPFKIFGIPIYHPLLLFKGYATITTQFTKLGEKLFQASLVFLFWTCLGIACIYAFSSLRTAIKKNENLHGSSRMGTKKDLKKHGLLYPYGGVVLGQLFNAQVDYDTSSGGVKLSLKKSSKIVQHAGETSTIVFAPSRSGKGVSSIVPTLRSYPHSMIIFDPKAENWDLTSGWRLTFSHVLRFSPVNKELTARFNPLMEISKEFAFRDANSLANILVTPADGKIDGSQKHWTDTAQDLLTACILHVLLSDYADKSLRGVLTFISHGAGKDSDNGEAMLKGMMEANHGDNEDLHNIIASAAMRQLGRPADERGSVFSSAVTALQVFEDPLVAYATSGHDFRLSDFQTTEIPISLYLTVPFSDIDRLAPLIRIIIVFMLTKFSSGETKHGSVALKEPILFLIDEAATLGTLQKVETMMGILNGYGIRFMLIFQSYSQVLKLYGENSPLLEHCRVVMTYANSDVKTAEMFSKLAGVKTITYSQQSSSGSPGSLSNSQSIGDQSIQVNVLNSDEIQHLPPNQALVFIQGAVATRIKKNVWYEDKRFYEKLFDPETKNPRRTYVNRKEMQVEFDALAKLPRTENDDWWKLDDSYYIPLNDSVMYESQLTNTLQGD